MCGVLVASVLVANHVVEMDLKGHLTIYTANAVMIKQGTRGVYQWIHIRTPVHTLLYYSAIISAHCWVD